MSTAAASPHPPSPKCFVSIGEAMVEVAPAQTVGAFTMGVAGDTLNTAWYLRALRPDWTTHYVSRVGSDAVSAAMLDHMRTAGIDTQFVDQDPRKTVGLYLISLRDGERSFSYWRGQSAARDLAADPARLAQALQGADMIYFSGITLAILDQSGRETLHAALTAARTRGATVAFDPNLRPNLWTSGAEMRREITAGAALSDIVLPSFDDEQTHFGDTCPAATMARYHSAISQTVIVKNGAGPIHYIHDGQTGEVAAPPACAIVDTTSAGDSFNAGLLAHLGGTTPLPDLITNASRIAGQVIGAKGALVPLDLSALSL